MGVLWLGLAISAVVKNQYEDLFLMLIGGPVYLVFALILFFTSFIKTLNRTTIRNLFVTSILWVVVVLFGIWTLLGLRNVLAAFL
jgi:hypothetical protein